MQLFSSLEWGDGDTVVGSRRVISDGLVCSYIADIGVMEEYRGKGVGSALMRETLKHTTLYTNSFKGCNSHY
ncbi:GNAT family N-acetyltransferase [Moritella sp. 5]|uniref:GNAT family N-acetyltransferase n=1 Tax=Moritella sp. 5 TaxID=2746231 RepID=UPI001BAD6E5F|nr:GNAT family N-acetyltransferase [Moritella sp. 5]